ncbi:MAG: DUF4105 domain-containing protein [Pseudobdellovibrionaceae bacterium]
MVKIFAFHIVFILSFTKVQANEFLSWPEKNVLKTSNIYKKYSTIDKKINSILPFKMVLALTEDAKNNGLYEVSFIDNAPADHAGKADIRGRKILLNSALLGNSEFLLRTLIHEISHIYDFLNVHDARLKKTIESCVRQYDPRAYDSSNKKLLFIPNDCQAYRWTYTSVSTLPQFLDIAGWFTNINSKGSRQSKTEFVYRLPDVYETRNSREYFAVNMEYFLLDPEFACRRPVLYSFLSKYFDHQPFENKKCGKDISYLKLSDKSWVKKIDFNRVYAIDYMQAGAGDSLASGFGHSLLRLVICSPERVQMGPACYDDIDSHLVLSFRAAITDNKLDLWKGLVGDYPSKLYFTPLVEILEEYNIKQWRDLTTYPMNLDRSEIENILYRAAEVHWSYGGNYYFISQNCAVEAINLLKSVVNNEKLNFTNDIQKPSGLLNVLFDAGLISKNNPLIQVFKSKEDDLESKISFIQSLFYVKVAQSSNIYYKNSSLPMREESLNLQSWLKTTEDYRKDIYSRLIIDRNDEEIIRISAAFLMLENEIERRKMGKYLFVDGSQLAVDNNFKRPLGLIQGAYGLPQQRELDILQNYYLNHFKKALLSGVVDKNLDPVVKKIHENKKMYLTKIIAKMSAK